MSRLGILASCLLLVACRDEKQLVSDALNAPSHGVLEVCPPDPAGKFGAYVDHVFIGTRNSAGGSTPRPENQKNVYRLGIVDLSTGARSRAHVETRVEKEAGPTCLGIDGDIVWVIAGGEVLQFDTSGTLRRDAKALEGEHPVFASLERAGFDTDEGKLVAETTDGRTHYIDGELEASAGPKNFANAARVTARQAVSGRVARLHFRAPQQRWDQTYSDQRGHSVQLSRSQGRRGSVVVDGSSLGGDFLEPHLVRAPDGQALVWDGPPSVVVAHPKSTNDEDGWGVVRRDLEGRDVVRIAPRPGPRSVQGPAYAFGATAFVHFGPKSIVGFDAVTGRQVWSTEY